MENKVYDFFKSLLWYIVDFIYSLIDDVITVSKKLNSFDIINSLSNNKTFVNLYHGIVTIAITTLALFMIWKFVMKLIDQDSEISMKIIFIESIKCSLLVLMTTFLFSQVASFSIKLSNYTSNVFEESSNATMSDNLLSMFIDYNDGYEDSKEFDESKTILESISDGSFGSDERYIEKYVTKNKIILSDKKAYKFKINWIMAILIGGFFLYSLFFVGIMLGRRQIEFVFLFAISPIVFATSICNKQRRGAVVEQLVSLALQSAIIMLILNITTLVMQEVNNTVFFADNRIYDVIIKSVFYLGCATFILTGSQVVNRFIGSNVSANSGREHLMALSGYGKLATAGAVAGTAATIGGGLLATGAAMKVGKQLKNYALTKGGLALGTMGVVDSSTGASQNRFQQVATSLGTSMYNKGMSSIENDNTKSSKISASDMMINFATDTLSSAVRTVAPRASYNASYYRRRNKIQ